MSFAMRHLYQNEIREVSSVVYGPKSTKGVGTASVCWCCCRLQDRWELLFDGSGMKVTAADRPNAPTNPFPLLACPRSIEVWNDGGRLPVFCTVRHPLEGLAADRAHGLLPQNCAGIARKRGGARCKMQVK